VLSDAARAIALFHLDRLWVDHLAELSEVREGVHLRVLGKLDPLDEFHRSASPRFKRCSPRSRRGPSRPSRRSTSPTLGA